MELEGLALSANTVYDTESLKEATDKMEGIPIVSGSDQIDDVIGEVTSAKYIEDEGVYYTAEIMDEMIMEKIDEGLVDLAPRFMYEEVGDEITELTFDRLFATPYPDESVPGVIDRKV